MLYHSPVFDIISKISPFFNVPNTGEFVFADCLIFKVLFTLTALPCLFDSDTTLSTLPSEFLFSLSVLIYSLETYPSLPSKEILYQSPFSDNIFTSCPLYTYPIVS